MKTSKFLTLFMVFMSVSMLNAQTWTFDCSQQDWGVRAHGQSITATHVLTSTSVNSGHIAMTTPAGLTHGWMFGPAEAIDEDLYKYLHLSLTVDQADEMPEGGLDWKTISTVCNTEIFGC